MGNHIVGNLFASGANAIKHQIPHLTQNEALSHLENIGEFTAKSYYFSADAEFDDFCNPKEPLGMLLIKSFAFAEFQKLTEIDLDKLNWESNKGRKVDKLLSAIYCEFKSKFNLC